MRRRLSAFVAAALALASCGHSRSVASPVSGRPLDRRIVTPIYTQIATVPAETTWHDCPIMTNAELGGVARPVVGSANYDLRVTLPGTAGPVGAAAGSRGGEVHCDWEGGGTPDGLELTVGVSPGARDIVGRSFGKEPVHHAGGLAWSGGGFVAVESSDTYVVMRRGGPTGAPEPTNQTVDETRRLGIAVVAWLRAHLPELARVVRPPQCGDRPTAASPPQARDFALATTAWRRALTPVDAAVRKDRAEHGEETGVTPQTVNAFIAAEEGFAHALEGIPFEGAAAGDRDALVAAFRAENDLLRQREASRASADAVKADPDAFVRFRTPLADARQRTSDALRNLRHDLAMPPGTCPAFATP